MRQLLQIAFVAVAAAFSITAVVYYVLNSQYAMMGLGCLLMGANLGLLIAAIFIAGREHDQEKSR